MRATGDAGGVVRLDVHCVLARTQIGYPTTHLACTCSRIPGQDGITQATCRIKVKLVSLSRSSFAATPWLAGALETAGQAKLSSRATRGSPSPKAGTILLALVDAMGSN